MATFSSARVLNYERVPIDAQDLVTSARIVIAGDLSDKSAGINTVVDPPFPEPHASLDHPYYPAPIVRAYDHALHATYGAERSFKLPSGVDPFLPRSAFTSEALAASVEFSGPRSALTDGNPTTFMHANTSIVDNPQLAWRAGSGREVVGCRLTYALKMTDGSLPFRVRVFAGTYFVQFGSPPVFYTITQEAELILDPSEEPREVIFVAPAASQDARQTMDPSWTAMRLMATGVGWEYFRVFDFWPLVINEPLVQDIAKAQIRLPASNPRRVTVRGLLPPADRQHTITGWPGGTYTGTVARQTYRDGNTIVDFEQAGAPPGVPAELLEAERVRVNRTDTSIRTATHPLTVGPFRR